ncbi:MAG: elongation factor G [Lachnospiraceae bacterium]|nr:elongation factor G [Lachnospiraceae bacterium]
MDTFRYESIRNVAVLGHGGCGKTTLVESMAFVTGITKRMGKVEEGNTISDYDKEENKRLFSINTTVVPILWENAKINFLDTPGYFDFVGEVDEALATADAAVIVVSAKAGLEVGTIKAWEACEKRKLPRVIFITDMDVENADYHRVVDELTETWGTKIAPFQSPIIENEKFTGIVNILKMSGRKFNPDGSFDEGDIPADCKDEADTFRETLMEAVAETSEEFMERFFDQGSEAFSPEEIQGALSTSVAEGSIVPVVCGSGATGAGVRLLLHQVVKYFKPAKPGIVVGKNEKTNEEFVADYDDTKPFSARVFKTIADPFIGKFSLIKIYTGVLHNDDVIYNAEKGTEEKLSRIYVLRGKEQIEVKELHAGDIGAIGKLSDTVTNDTLSTKENPVIYEKFSVTVPYTYRAYTAKNKNDDDKISSALSKLMEEDLTLKVVHDKENHQALIYGIGEQQLEVVVSKLLTRYKAEVEISMPRVAYREAIRKKVEVRGKHKKQSGGHGQYGDVQIIFEPSENMEKGYEFFEQVYGGSVPKNFFPAVEKGLEESVTAGPLAGYPVVGLKATLTDGSYHPVDSNEMSFKMATVIAFKDGFMKAGPVLLEPIADMKVLVPDKFTGDVMGDLNKRRGRVMGMNPVSGGKQEILAEVPVSELFSYSTDLRSMTGGIGEYEYHFNRYEQAPTDVMNKAIEEAKKRAEEEK